MMVQYLSSPIPAKAFRDKITAAERYMKINDNREAIRFCIEIASLLGDRTPENVYHLLSQAYAQNKESFGGTQEENQVWGDRDKHEILETVHAQLEPELYLEIGVDQGISLSLARGRAIGVDARPDLNLKKPLGNNASLVKLSSDAFFREQAEALLTVPPGLVFIDGMHLFEFALRDFMNAERFASYESLVIVDDIFPCHPAQAARLPRTDSWTGDVWKLQLILRESRPDLKLISLNAKGTGLLLIAGLDPANRVLWKNYDQIVRTYGQDIEPPSEILKRMGTSPSDYVLVTRLLALLNDARQMNWSHKQVREALWQLSA